MFNIQIYIHDISFFEMIRHMWVPLCINCSHFLFLVLYIDCYSVDDDDHCETPENAYADINKTLEYMLCHTQKDQFANQTETRIIETCKDKCMIYDPFFCQGSVVKRLGAQGYSNVYNKVRNSAVLYEDDQMVLVVVLFCHS